MRKVKELFISIAETNSRLQKQQILKDNADNKNFTDTLVFLLSPFVLTGISTKKIDKKLKPLAITKNITDWNEMRKYLATHNTGTDNDIRVVQKFITNQDSDMRTFYEMLITKSLRLGIDAKTVNEIIPNLIPTFNVQLGTSIENCKLKGDEYIYISQKLNGNRCVYYDGKLYSRQGKVFTGLEHIISDIEKMPCAKEYVFDGELIGKNEEGLTDSENFQQTCSIANSKDKDKSSLKLVLFDVLPKEEFEHGQSSETYCYRKVFLSAIVGIAIKQHNLQNIELVQFFYEGNDHEQIWKWLEYCEEHDYEGCMVNLDVPYYCKRVKTLMKVKQFKDIDLRCIRVNKANIGKYKNKLGAITCRYGESEVDVGSGFSDDMRSYYIDNPDAIVGKIVSVKYKEETTNKNGGRSLQFPVFMAVREDKEKADDE